MHVVCSCSVGLILFVLLLLLVSERLICSVPIVPGIVYLALGISDVTPQKRARKCPIVAICSKFLPLLAMYNGQQLRTCRSMYVRMYTIHD